MSFWYRNDVCSNNRLSYSHKKLGLRTVGGAVCVLCVLGAVVRAQDRLPPGMVANFNFQQRLEYSDNPDLEVDGDSDFFGRTILGFGLESTRSIDRFALNLSTDIEEGRDGQSDFDPTNIFGNLVYNRETRNALARVALRYREADVTSTADGRDFDLDGNVIDPGEGTRQSYGLQLEGAIGREAPIGASFRLSQDRINYSDTSDPDQQDSSRDNFSGQIDFRLTPRITANLTTIYRDLDTRGDGVDRRTTGFGSGVSLVVTSVDTVDFSVSQDRVERSGSQTGTDEGLSASAGWLRELSNGSLGVNYSSEITSNDDGRRSFFSINRNMALPTGSLSLTLGTTGSDALGTDPLVQADYVHNLSTAVLSLGLSQRVNTDSNNNEEINTRLRASYNQQINNLSSFGASLSFFDRNELQDNPNDGQRLDLSLTYRHDLTRNWGVVSGFTHRLSTQDRGEDRSSNTVFIGLSHNFSWNP